MGVVPRLVQVTLATLVAATVLLAPARASAVVYEPEPAFCQQSERRDYLAPIDRLPQLRQPRPDGTIGFAKANVRMKLTEQLVAGPGKVGFVLFRPYRTYIPVIHPSWTVTATLARIDAGGRILERLGTRTMKVRALGHGKMAATRFAVGPELAFYRLTIVFRSAKGRKLAKYGHYVRVVDEIDDVRLVLDASSYRREETVFAQLQNPGTTTWSYGYGYRIEKLTPGGWVEAPENPRLPVPLVSRYLTPGTATDCEEFWIPPSTEPGHYRLLRGTLAAEFDVLP